MDEKKHIGQLFDRIAGSYDRFNHLLSLNIDRHWRRRTVKKLRAAANVLDVAVGTGDLAIEIVRAGKSADVTGLDLSVEMMKIGESKAARKGLSGNIRFDTGSALQMPYPDASFAAVTCAYGVRNFSDIDSGLREMYRVMKPGGQLAILEFSYPTAPVIRTLYDFFFCRIMPIAGRIISRDASAYKYFRQSVKEFMTPEELVQHIAAAGFNDIGSISMTFGISTLYLAEKK